MADLKPKCRTEVATCMDCGKEYQQVIYERRNGTEVPPDPRCDECSAAYDDRMERERREKELAAATIERRRQWDGLCGIPKKFADATFENFDKTKQPKAFKAMSEWDGKSLILASPPGIYGVGKTHLAAALAHKLMATTPSAMMQHGAVLLMPLPVMFTTEPLLMERIRSTFNRDAEEHEDRIFAAMEKVGLLIIDDVGKRQPRDLSFTQQVWYRVIDGRYTGNRPIILTTNLLPRELEEHVGGACADRLDEMCGPSGMIALKGESQRRVG